MTHPPPKAVLLDRDGVLNVKPAGGEYVRLPGELHLLPGAATALARLNRAGVRALLVTNQRGVALGRMSAADLEAVHERLRELLAREDARLDAIHVCPHDIGTCDCRKPKPGLLLRAMHQAGLAPDDCLMIGDSPSDLQAARAAGVRAIHLGAPAPDLPDCACHARDLAEAVAWLLGEQG